MTAGALGSFFGDPFGAAVASIVADGIYGVYQDFRDLEDPDGGYNGANMQSRNYGSAPVPNDESGYGPIVSGGIITGNEYNAFDLIGHMYGTLALRDPYYNPSALLEQANARYQGPFGDSYSGNDNDWRLPANDWRRSSRDDRDRASRKRDDDDGPSGNSGGTDNSAPSGGKNGFFSGSNSYGNSSFDSGPKPGYSNPTNVSSPSTGEKVYDKGVYDLEGPEATGAGTYVQMRLAEGLPISRGTAA